MKKYSNLTYTATAKKILVVLIILSGWLASSAFNLLFTYSVENSVGVKNFWRQGFSFDYESSTYADAQVENTIGRVLEYSLKYMHSSEIEKAGSKVKLDRELRKNNDKYSSLMEKLDSLDNVYFAVVNHSTGKIVSNLPEVDGVAAAEKIRHHFADKGKYFIAAYNCKNPYFEQGFSERFVESIREYAEEYPDNFDLYISFGNSLYIVSEDYDFELLHNNTIRRLRNNFMLALIPFFILTVLTLRMISISGKSEKGSRIYPTTTDSLPNDILIVFYLMIIISACVMYHTSIYMLYKVCTVEDFGLGMSPEYYMLRMNASVCTATLTSCMLIVKIKRQKYFGTLFTNTFIFRAISLIRKKMGKNA